MKKLLFAFAAVAVTMTACKKDETDDLTKNENPVLTLTAAGGTTVEAGSIVSLTISVRANDDGDKIKTVALTDADDFALFYIEDVNETSLDTTITFVASSAFETSVYTLAAGDKKDHIAVKTISIITVSGFASEESGEFYHISAPTGYEGAYDFVNDVRVASTENDSIKDMIHNDGVGVFTGSWTSNNGTMYVKATALDFDATTYSTTVSTYSNLSSTASVGMVSPVEGEVYIAKLRGNQGYALIKITSNNATNADCGCQTNRGKLSFDYKK